MFIDTMSYLTKVSASFRRVWRSPTISDFSGGIGNLPRTGAAVALKALDLSLVPFKPQGNLLETQRLQILGAGLENLFPCLHPQKGQRWAKVSLELADLRKKTSAEPEIRNGLDLSLTTQLINGEPVQIMATAGPEWVKVKAAFQLQKNIGGAWDGYEGYVKSSSIKEISHEKISDSLATLADQLVEEDLRNIIIEHSRTFVDTPYLWGGLSSQGIDCSGLVHLAFRQSGLIIPRDSGPIYSFSYPLKMGQDLKPGDIIYLSPIKKGDSGHLLLFIGENAVIEAAGSPGKVIERTLPFPLDQIVAGEVYPETNSRHQIYFGSLLSQKRPVLLIHNP